MLVEYQYVPYDTLELIVVMRMGVALYGIMHTARPTKGTLQTRLPYIPKRSNKR